VGSFMQQHLAPLVAGVILVVNTRRQGVPDVVRAAKAVSADGGTLLGVVLNRHRSPLPRWLDRWGDRP
jgi:Mrp family chromosome partitioning ATPase